MKNKIQFSLMPKSAGRGMLCIYVIASQHGRSVNIDTSVRIFKDEWDDREGIVVKNPNAKSLNKHLRQAIYDLETIEFDSDGNIGINKLKRSYENRTATDDFYAMAEHAISTRNVRESTKASNMDWLRKIKKFSAECSMCDLTEEWIKEYHYWLVKRGDAEGTINKNMQTFRLFWNIARKTHGNKVADDAFDWYHPKSSKAFKQKGLDDDDIRMIENFVATPGQNAIHKFVMEQFLFMSYTGCRYSDFNSLTRDNFKYDNGKLWLSYVSVKTNTPVHIPLFALFDGRAEQLYYKHQPDFEQFFHLRAVGGFNKILKTVCKKIGLSKKVTSHVARHTCASRLINRDVPVTTIQKVIGHRQIKMTMQYAHTNDTALVKQLLR